MANFTNFNYTGTPSSTDFIVGYKGDGTVEQRTTLSDLVSSGLASKGVFLQGDLSVAIGSDGNTVNSQCMAIGDANNAQGLNSLAQGNSNITAALYSTAMGYNNKATGDVTFAQGDSNQATGEASFAQGTLNIAEGTYSQAQGYGNIASGIYSQAEGYNNCTGGYIAGGVVYGGSHAQGGYNVVAIPLAHAQGFGNRIGYLQYVDWYASNPPRLGFGFQGITLSSFNIYGLNNPALSSTVRLFFISDNGITTYSAYVSSTQDNYNDPYGGTTGFTIFLRNDASAVLPPDDFFGPQIVCVPLTAYDGSTSFSNIGVGAFAQGYNNFVAGTYASAQGSGNTAAGFASHAAGYSSSTGPNAANAFAHGYSCIAYGRASHAMGTRAYAGHDYSYVWNSNPNVPGDYFRSSLSGQYCVNAPGGIMLSGGNTSVEGLVVANAANIVGDWPANLNFIEKLSASSMLGASNSAVYLNVGVPGFTTFNWGTDINGGYNVVNAGASNVQGVRNYAHGAGVQVTGFSNSMGFHASTVEGICNTVNRVATIAKTVSATNTIFLHEAAAVSQTFGITPGQRIVVDGIQIATGSVSTSFNTRQIFTVATATAGAREFTVVEPLTSMYAYKDNAPYADGRYVVGISVWSTSGNLNYTGSHAEGSFNYITNKNSHAEGMNNVVAALGGHAEGVGNFAGSTSHAEGTETRAGMNIVYFDSYNADTKTFQLYTNHLSTFNTFDVSTLGFGSVLYFVDTQVSSTSTRRNMVRFTLLSADAALGTVTALSAVRPTSIAPAGTGVLSRERQLMSPNGSNNHTQGAYTVASNASCNAEGYGTIAKGYASHAGGLRSTAQHDYSYAWSSGDGTLAPDQKNHATTRTGQYMVSAHGGVFLPGKVGIGTDSMDNALTVAGTISATTITADNIAYTNAGFTNLPTYKTYQTNVAVKNANWPAVSAAQLAETGYSNSQATYAIPGGLIIKGHALDYNNTPRNLPNLGVYGMYLQNVDSFDPGTTFVSDGRAQVTHGMTFRAGINNFTGGSDHNHVTWNGSPSNSTQAWQMTNGGNNGSVYGYTFPYTNRFMVHTLPQGQISTTIAAISGFIDTREANLVTGTDRLSGVKLLVSRDVSTGNYNLINVGEVISLTVNPGLVGIVAASYNSQVTQISANAALSSFEFNSYIGNGDNWKPAQRGIQPISLLSRTNGGNPGVSLITSQIGSDPSTQYVGLTGSYRGINRHMLARFTNASLLTGFKTGSPLTLWIPPLMPSTSPIGTGIISSDKISTFAQGTFPTGVRSGYFDAYVININGADLEFALCNLMDSYSFESRSWPYTATGNAGWLLYGGTQDSVHRPTFGTTGFYFEREPWSGGANYLSGGMVKNVVLGTSESYGSFSYGLGWRGVVLGDRSGTFAGDYNTVFGNNSVALGGNNLINNVGRNNQVVMGTFNNPNTNALLVVGNGTSNANRSNTLEVESNQVNVYGNVTATGFSAPNAVLESTQTIENYVADVGDAPITSPYTMLVFTPAGQYTSLSAVVLMDTYQGNPIIGATYFPGFKQTIVNVLGNNEFHAHANIIVKTPTSYPDHILYNLNGDSNLTSQLMLSAGYKMELVVTQGYYVVTSLNKIMDV